MFAAEEMFPNFTDDVFVFFCTAGDAYYERYDEAHASPESVIDDQDYYYIPYATTNEADGMAFVEAYREFLREGSPLPPEIPMPDGGALKLAQFRYSQGETTDDTPIVPIMFEKPDRHSPRGSNVLFSDGHVRYIRLSNGTYPITESFFEALASIDQ